MRAALLPDYKADLVIDEVPVPDPGPGEVLVRVAGAGLCHLDLHLAAGDVPVLPRFPWILGHEVTGWVEALGPGAHGFEHGEPVAVHGGWGCGMCRLCLSGEEQLCATTSWVGVGQPGGYAEYLVVPAPRHLVPLGDLDPISSAPLTDAALTAYRAVRRALPRLVPGTTAVVIGAGGVGQYAVQMVRELSPADVVVLEPAETRRTAALELGATAALHPDDNAVPDLDGGAAAVLDLVGSEQSLALAGRLAAAKAEVVVVGLGRGTLPVGPLTAAPEVRIGGSLWGSRTELGEVVELARTGRLTTRVHERDLSAVNTAMRDLAGGEVDGRIVLVP